MTDERLDQLIDAHLNGAMTDDERRELDARLLHSAADRGRFWQLSETHVLLHEGLQQRVTEPPLKSTPRRVSHPLRWLAAAAAIAVGCVLGWRAFVSKPVPPQPFATLAAANEAQWADPNVELMLRGGELPPGPLRLESGTAEFLCADGATVVMRGPATVRFPSRKRVAVESGKVFCRCPSPESRLSVETPTTEVVDLGTEFAVDARADRSTVVAVLSGEVQVGKAQQRRLHKGEAVEVRGDGILAIQPLAREEFSELLLASPAVGDAMRRGENRLQDPGFENGLTGRTWSGTETNLEAVGNGGRSGNAVRVFARGYANWPQCRQKIATGDIAGKLVVASVWASTPAQDPLRPRQVAMLKIVFVNEEGRDFAFAMRRFLSPKSEPDRFEQAQLAAFAPPGTRQVQIQLMLNSNLLDSGSVVFDDASLVIADAPAKN
jgi:hypothetical protein